MDRRPLKTITETIFRRKKVIPGWIYIRKAPMGPPVAVGPVEEAIDDLIRDVAVSHDFSPLLSGDRRQAQKVAEDFVADVRAAAANDDLVEEEALTARLMGLFDRSAQPDWPWFEEDLTYDNAKLAHALILSGRSTGQPAVS